jgi:hypothetical protein
MKEEFNFKEVGKRTPYDLPSLKKEWQVLTPNFVCSKKKSF